jgi:flagellar basal-body rod modification protein FlgD
MSTSTPGVNGTSGTTLTPTGTTGTNLAPADSSLSKNDFLMLMMDQLKNQDPLNPGDPTQYLSELASFSSLEQETNIAGATSATSTQQAAASALTLLGRSVTYANGDGTTSSGTVSKVDFTADGPTLTVGAATGISMSSITEAS